MNSPVLPPLHQLSYISKRMDLLESKVDSSIADINSKLAALSNKINHLNTDQVPNFRLLNTFNKHLASLSKDIQELSSYGSRPQATIAPNPVVRYQENDRTENINHDTSRQHDFIVRPESTRADFLRQNHDLPMRNDMAIRHSQSQEMTQRQPASQVHETTSLRLWPKNLKSPAPQPNSAPSSPFASNKFSFDFSTFPLERSASFSRMLGQQDTTSSFLFNQPQQTQQDLILPMSKKSRNNANNFILSLGNPSLLGTGTSPTATEGTPDATNAASAPPANTMNQNNNSNSASATSLYQLNNFDNDTDSAIENLDHTIHEMGMDQVGVKKRRNTFSSSQNSKVKLVKSQLSTPKSQQVLLDSATSPNRFSKLVLSQRMSGAPQYKLEKSLKSVQEIWDEYEYGLNDKPPLKMLENKFNAKWRNETESRTFLRRKKIYDAIEIGKRKGFDESSIIEELEQLRMYSHFNSIKKRPLQWLYSNIPSKYCNNDL